MASGIRLGDTNAVGVRADIARGTSALTVIDVHEGTAFEPRSWRPGEPMNPVAPVTKTRMCCDSW